MKSVWHKIRNHFASGLLVLAPFFLTMVVVGYLIRLADHMVVDPFFNILPFHPDATVKILLTKLVIACVVILCVTLLGVLAEKFLFKQLLMFGEMCLKSIPFFNKIYGSFQEIAQAFFGDKSGVFKRVVFVEYPRTGLYSLGFVTQEKKWELSQKTGKDMLNVFVPHPPNPATGALIFVLKSEAVETNLSVEEGIKLVVSAGAAVPALKA